ncbi:hypothetical protein [Cupriavidus malaysiensis]|uniref:hypothetical protein n=1 Tax=Cupriavidus malaysiensis TaxID=367825 RepID=UPI0012FF7422|nr:hypothetical protein [Cupriavidus malaysiensis]
MSTSRYPRGTILRCFFPYDTHPQIPGPKAHYCLLAEQVELPGESLLAVCYGTSRLDNNLIRKHNGVIFSVPSGLIRGTMTGPVTHFVADHVALIKPTERWMELDWSARLDFMRPEKRENDPRRARLYTEFQAVEEAALRMVEEAVLHFQATGTVGLLPGKTLR